MQKNTRDQIIEGILDGDAVEDLLQIKDLTLDKAIQVCQAQEAAKKQLANMIGIHHESVAVIRNAPRKKPPSHTVPGYSATCPGCGNRLHQGGRARCPAFGLLCNNCGKLGHFAKVCRSRPSLPEPKPTLTAQCQSTKIYSSQILAMLLHPTQPPKLSLTLLLGMAQHPLLFYQTKVLMCLQLVKQYFIISTNISPISHHS